MNRRGAPSKYILPVDLPTEYNLSGHIFKLPSKYMPRTLIGMIGCNPICSASNKETKTSVVIVKKTNGATTESEAKSTIYRMSLRNHKNVVELIDLIAPTLRKNSKEPIYFVYEHMSCNLHQAIYSGIEISDTVKCVVDQLLRGLKYFHSAPIVLRYLNLNNVLVNKIDDLYWEAKICPYLLGHSNSEKEYLIRYQAPEVFLKSQTKVTTAADIWSLGCIFIELLTRRQLFAGVDEIDQLYDVFKLLGSPSDEEIWSLCQDSKSLINVPPLSGQNPLITEFPHVDGLAIDLVSKMIVFDPRKRITASEALTHPYLAGLHSSGQEPEPEDTPFCPSMDVDAFDYEQLMGYNSQP